MLPIQDPARAATTAGDASPSTSPGKRVQLRPWWPGIVAWLAILASAAFAVYAARPLPWFVAALLALLVLNLGALGVRVLFYVSKARQ